MAIGIDFGTSNSAVSYTRDGQTRLIELENEKSTIPTAVFYNTDEKEILFGNKAIADYVDGYEGRLLRSLKSVLGSSLINSSTEIGYKNIKFKNIIGEFIGHLKKKTELFIGETVDNVVLGRPVRFVDSDDQADAEAQNCLEEIARRKGFKNILFQYEPIAAALDYEQTVDKEELALIVDIGGGTSDFSIVRVSPDKREKEDRKGDILANTGVHVGGSDLDKKLSIGQVMSHFGYRTNLKPHFPGGSELEIPSRYFHDLATWHKIVFLYNPRAIKSIQDLHFQSTRPDLTSRFVRIMKDQEGHRLAGDVEASKIELSKKNLASLSLKYVERGLKTELYRAKFESDINTDKEKIVFQISECIRQAGITSSAVNTVFFTGGSTAIPLIAKACMDEVPSATVIHGDRFSSVGIGLGIDAHIRFASPSLPKLQAERNQGTACQP